MHREFELREREITPEDVFLRRRDLLVGGAAAAGALTIPRLTRAADEAPFAPELYPARRNAELSVDLAPTAESLAAEYNNFYEFGSTKSIAGRAQGLTLRPWTVEIGGLCERTGTHDVEALVRRFSLEERVYRFRCVEAWAMVVPWTGFPLRALVEWAAPRPEARYVRFETFHRPSEAIGQVLSFWYPWPYVEGLRIDEATNELALVATGIYGKPLPRQHGAPLRIVVPWKYGFKSGKSLVRIDFVAERPDTFWNHVAPQEYGFEANVDPEVPHPRWSQATERLLGSDERQPTLKYNGYEKWVAALYRS